MQITLVQTEIEQAIRNFVLSQLAIRDGQKIEIELRATRGSDGATAIIDITQMTAQPSVPVDVVKPAPTPASAPGQTISTALKRVITTSDLKKMQEEEAAQEAKAEAEAAEAAAVIGTNDESAQANLPVSADEPVAQDTAVVSEEPSTPAAATVTAAAGTAPRRLFAGFTKQVNNAA